MVSEGKSENACHKIHPAIERRRIFDYAISPNMPNSSAPVLIMKDAGWMSVCFQFHQMTRMILE